MTQVHDTKNSNSIHYSLDLEALKQFAEKSIQEIERPNRYPFRDRYLHTLRVLSWARRIQALEGGDLETIEVAAICHDIGWDEHINHAIISRQLAKPYLLAHHYDETKLEKTLQAIEMHNNRSADKAQFNIESLIVMDADILDEVGALSVTWDIISASYEPTVSYRSILEKIKEYHGYIANRREYLQTETGLRFYNERIGVIERFIADYQYELG